MQQLGGRDVVEAQHGHVRGHGNAALAQSAGDNVSETKAEMIVALAMVIANCL